MTRATWEELFVSKPWPGTSAAAVAALVEEVKGLRKLAAGLILQPDTSLRDTDDVQLAHDLLVQLILDERLCADVLDPGNRAWLVAVAEVLCWVLRHEHNPKFAEHLAAIQARFQALGFEVCRFPELRRRDGSAEGV